MKFKVGDKVQVKGLEWYLEQRNTDTGAIDYPEATMLFNGPMSDFCGGTASVLKVVEGDWESGYILNIGPPRTLWEDWMLEDTVV